MANANIEVKVVPVTNYNTVEVINLELTKEEAETLRFILNRIGGTPSNSPRKHADSITTALRHVGIQLPKLGVNDSWDNKIFFTEYPTMEPTTSVHPQLEINKHGLPTLEGVYNVWYEHHDNSDPAAEQRHFVNGEFVQPDGGYTAFGIGNTKGEFYQFVKSL